MDKINDDVFGNMNYDYGWVRGYSYVIFGMPMAVRLFVPCDKGARIEDSQRAAFLNFDKNKDTLSLEAESAIFDYYQGICGEYRERLGVVYADKQAPILTECSQVKNLIHATEIIVQQTFGSEERVIGLLFTCTWEPELGLAVKFVNEEIEGVGPQDIVL